MVIGITGGVGSGKSAVLNYLNTEYSYRIIKADEVANYLKLRGNACYDALIKLLGEDIIGENLEIDNFKMASKIFSSNNLLENTNKIIHPEVKKYILSEIDKKDYEIIFIEAALLIEDCYLPYLDELWYIYACEDIRIGRLIDSRGYSLDKVKGIMEKQMSDDEFRSYADYVIDNSYDIKETFRQIDARLREYRL